MEKCSPNYENELYSCFTKDALFIIINAYNKSYPKNKITVSKNSKKQHIWKEIQKKLEQECGANETCWLNMEFLKDYPSLEQYFKPLGPLGRYQWLSTSDIKNVMSQLEQKYKFFKFVGPVPMDFAELQDEDSIYLQKLNLLKTPYKQIGVIFNLDPSTKKGSHWVAMNIDLNRKYIAYFDSYGEKYTFQNKANIQYIDSYGKNRLNEKRIPMPPEIQKYVKQLLNKNNLSNEYVIRINTIQHQYANSECGIYGMIFIKKSLNEDFDKISTTIITDEVANNARNKFFRYG